MSWQRAIASLRWGQIARFHDPSDHGGAALRVLPERGKGVARYLSTVQELIKRLRLIEQLGTPDEPRSAAHP